jgi:hypothetical protein
LESGGFDFLSPAAANVMARPVLIITITIMVLISLHPFAVRKILLLAVALLGLSSACCFADPLFMTRQYEPYRNQTRTRPVMAPLANLDKLSPLWRSFESSAERSDDLVGFLAPFGETSPVSSERIVAAFTTPACWRSDASLKFALSARQNRSSRSF